MTAGDEGRCDCGSVLTQCSDCAVADWQAAHADCPTCCPTPADEGRAAARRAEIERQVRASGVCEAFQSAMGQEHCQRCGRNEYLHWLRELLAECDRLSRAVEALPQQWRENAEKACALAIKHQGDDSGNTHAFLKERRIWNTCADELDAALASPAPAAEDKGGSS
jgi:hypothetical protein